MGIFGTGYTQPGKGVDKNEPKKRGPFLFFEIIWHKFMKFLGANCLYAMTSIIWLALLWFFGKIIIANTGVAERLAQNLLVQNPAFTIEEIAANVSLILETLFVVSVFTLWGSGPATAAYAYIGRCFTRGEHAWIISDGLDKFKENFKQGMLVLLIDAVILVFGLNAMYFYHTLYAQSQSALWLALEYIMLVLLVLYTMMHPFIYQIMITFECGIGAIYKNALILTLAKLPVNIILNFIGAALIFGVFWSISNPIVAVLLLLIFGLCFTLYPRDFYAARVIERSILRDIKAKQPKIEYIEEEQ